MTKVTLQILSGEYSVCRLAAGEPVPAWADSPVFSSVTRTADELTVMCPIGQAPATVQQEKGWRVFKFQGPFQFTTTGILSAVLGPLAAAGVPILAQSTFDTDYLFVKAANAQAAINALRAAGHTVLT